VTTDARSWIDRFADQLGVPALPEHDVEAILALASVAAHASERTAAPLSCWLAAVAGLSPADALAAAQKLAAEMAPNQ
jgi:hypothetical protein